MQSILNGVGNFLLLVLAIVLFCMYIRNIYKLYLDVQSEKYTLITVARGFGIFFPFLGIVMGFV